MHTIGTTASLLYIINFLLKMESNRQDFYDMLGYRHILFSKNNIIRIIQIILNYIKLLFFISILHNIII